MEAPVKVTLLLSSSNSVIWSRKAIFFASSMVRLSSAQPKSIAVWYLFGRACLNLKKYSFAFTACGSYLSTALLTLTASA